MGQKVEAQIDEKRRIFIQNNHTATHILHWALCKVLGPHIKQAGSVVDEKRLRFDFSHHKALTRAQIRQIEMLVNEKIRTDEPVKTYEMRYSDVQKENEIKQFFGDKYGDEVRVVDVSFSKELCGGTHTSRLGTIGLFKIAKESSIAAGVRRIEALTAQAAEKFIQSQEDLVEKAAEILKTNPSLFLEKLELTLEEQKSLSLEIKQLRKEQGKQLIEECLEKKEPIGDTTLIATIVDVDPKDLNAFANELLQKLQSGIVALGVKIGEKCQLLVGVTPDLQAFHAGNIIKKIAPLIQGGGGGKQNMAQAGGKKAEGLFDALDEIRELIKQAHGKVHHS